MAQKNPAPAPIKQDDVSQAEIIVLLDWLDKLAGIAHEHGDPNLARRLNTGYNAVEAFRYTTK